MKNSYIYIFAVVVMLCAPICLFAEEKWDSPVVEMLESHKESKTLEGTKFKIAKPFIKKTPMGVILDEINMLVICPMDLTGEKKDHIPADEALQTLKNYNLVREIDDEKSTMTIYIDTPRNDKFSEIILYNTKPEASIMLFVGDFTVESLIKVGEASEQERKHLKKNR